MNQIIKANKHNELIAKISDCMDAGYEFEELDGSFSDGGAIIMRNYESDDKIAIVCEEDTEADMMYGDLYVYMQQASKIVFKSYMRSTIYNK